MTGIRTHQRTYQPRKEPRQARSRETVDVLLEAAAQVFDRDGYAAATTDAVAERAGVSVGSLYQYFPSKDALLVALADRHLADIERALGRVVAFLAATPPLEEVAPRMVSEIFALHAAAPGLHRVLTEEAPIPATLVERWSAIEVDATRALADYLVASAELAVEDPALAAHMAVTLVESSAHRHTLYPLPGRGAQMLEAATARMVMAYLETFRG